MMRHQMLLDLGEGLSVGFNLGLSVGEGVGTSVGIDDQWVKELAPPWE